MDTHLVRFNGIPWAAPAPGLRTKTFSQDGSILRLVEFGLDFIEPNWCTAGHRGIVLQGTIDLQFAAGIERFTAGDALVIPPGESHRHKHHATIETALLFLVEGW